MLNNDYIKKLPDCFEKAENSNNEKLLRINYDMLQALRTEIQKLSEALDINSVTGYTLDLYGEMLGQERGQLDDGRYKVLIMAAILKNLCKCDGNSIIDIMALVFDCDKDDFCIKDYEEESATVTLEKLPYSVLMAVGITGKEAARIVKQMLPAGVKLYADNFEGSFELGTIPMVKDNEKGFGNIEGTIGGSFGMALGRDESIMPIL